MFPVVLCILGKDWSSEWFVFQQEKFTEMQGEGTMINLYFAPLWNVYTSNNAPLHLSTQPIGHHLHACMHVGVHAHS